MFNNMHRIVPSFVADEKVSNDWDHKSNSRTVDFLVLLLGNSLSNPISVRPDMGYETHLF